MHTPIAETTYVLPIRRTIVEPHDDLAAYLEVLARLLPVVVVDGSPPAVFAAHRASWPRAVEHVPVDEDRRIDLNGKVAGVVTGLRRVRTPKAVIADDDVRYDPFALRRVAALLDGADVVRPQNVFVPLPWHALLDTGRTLIARATGGDWPGTLGVRMDAYRRAGEYDGDVLFENLELVRTVRAAGGREHVAYDLFVERRAPATARYLSQRVRQAYDELARPRRLAVQLSLAPAMALAAYRFGPAALAAFALGSVLVAESGRRRADGRRVFPALAAACAPAWVAERALTSWAALGLRLARGGVRYSHGRLRVAANSERALRERYAAKTAPALAAVQP
ncbi:MAG: glycosyltransferase family 2 protein [Candidatus Eremiobacteraeota bacterium]|nr:glycosyltransferase family 2 protein [Candidatus Eremiobacteraeota bacterium]